MKMKFGSYTAVAGKLSPGDSRPAYVTGPSSDGAIRPLASFWTLAEAIAWAQASDVRFNDACAEKEKQDADEWEHERQPEQRVAIKP